MSSELIVDGRPLAHEHTGVHKYLLHLLAVLGDQGREVRLLVPPALSVATSAALAQMPNVTLVPFTMTSWRIARGAKLMPHQNTVPPLVGRTTVVVHDLTHLGEWSPIPKRAAFAALLRWHRLRRSDVITVSQATRAELVRAGFSEAAITVIAPALETKASSHSVSQSMREPMSVVCITSERPHKGLAVLLEAMKQVVSAHPEVVLHLVVAESSKALDEIITSCPAQVGPHLQLHLGVSDEERTALLRGSAVLVTPSLAEGYGYPLREGLAAGCAVVATSLAAHQEDPRWSECVAVEPGDAGALGVALVKVLG